MKNIIEILLVDFVSKKQKLITFEIMVILLVNTQGQLIKNIILMSQRKKVILLLLRFVISVFMIVIYFLKC